MANQRPIEERVQMVILYAKYGNFEAVRRDWNNHHNSDAPSIPTIRSTYRRFTETGSVADLPRTGRPRTSTDEETVEMVEQHVLNNPEHSTRRGALATGLSHSSYYRSLRELGMRSYKAQLVVQLSDDDFDRREQFCGEMTAKFDNQPDLLDKILWSDESEFKLNGSVNRHNCVYWASENPHNQEPHDHTSRGVMVWCGITSARIIGPYFFDGPVNAQSYTEMLDQFLWPKIHHRGLYFQQDGAPAHYSQLARDWLDNKLPERWIGRRGPIDWPARSPDLTPCDFYLWGRLKDIVYRQRSATLAQLRDRIIHAVAEISPEETAAACRSVPRRLADCIANEGRQLPD